MVAKKNKPCILATGASTLKEVKSAIKIILKINKKICLMQCNTNYTGNQSNLNYINLNVLKTYKKTFPKIILGLSDHTAGHATVLGAVTLGAKIIEKHYTLDRNQEGPDHKFAMDPKSWQEMVYRSRELELSLGTDEKKIIERIVSEVGEQYSISLANKSVKEITPIIAGSDIYIGNDSFGQHIAC